MNRHLLTLLTLIGLATGVSADDRPVLVVMFGAHNAPPIAIVSQSGSDEIITGGILFDIGAELAARADARVRYKFIPRKRQAQSLLQGDTHVYCEWNPAWTSEASKLFWSEPLYISEDLYVVRADRAGVIDTFESLNGMVVGAIRGFTYSPDFMAAVDSGRVVRVDVNTNEQSLMMLDLKRVEAIVIERTIASYLFSQSDKPLAFRIEPLIDDAMARFCAFSPKSPVPASELQKATAAMKADGTIERILQRYR